MTYFAAIPCPHCGTYTLLGGDPCDCLTSLPPVIIGEGDLDDQIRYAIRCVCGEDRKIGEVRAIDGDLVRDAFPDGTRHFVVISSCANNGSGCQHMDRVIWYRDRSVVVKESQMHTILLGNILKPLKGE